MAFTLIAGCSAFKVNAIPYSWLTEAVIGEISSGTTGISVLNQRSPQKALKTFFFSLVLPRH